MFLHASFMHLTMNVLSTAIIGSGLERGLGWGRLLFLYVMSGFGAILFSCTVSPGTHSVGASTAIFGMIGYYVAYLIINWTALSARNPMQPCFLIIFVVIIVMFNM